MYCIQKIYFIKKNMLFQNIKCMCWNDIALARLALVPEVSGDLIS